MRISPLHALVPALVACAACKHVEPPPSQFPDAESALARMRATAACGNALQADAKIDHFGARGRVRGNLLMFVARPERIRMDALSPPPLMQPVATLTSDGARFALNDKREGKFFFGRASACNIARLTAVPIPGHALVDLLRGQAPVLKHLPGAATIAWDTDGYYVIKIPSTRDATEEIHLTPRPDDWSRPWGEQRLRVRKVRVRQYGDVLYDADLDDHEVAPMASPRVDPDGLEPPIPPSGPQCDAEVPRKIHVKIPNQDADVQFRYEQFTWNPPLPDGTFVQPQPAGVQAVPVECD